MGKVGGSSWLNVVKKAFRSPSKDQLKEKREEHQQDEDEKKRGKRRWIFRKPLFRETTIQHNNEETNSIINPNAISETVNHALARNSACYNNTNEVEKRCTIAAALATAAAAEATQAAMEVIRLTNTRLPYSALRIREHLHFAAITIQTAFRGYLARKALKALKGLVKLQALVRGHNVRGRTKMTLQCMQSMVRVQTQLCDQRSRRLSSSSASLKETRNSISISRDDIYTEMEEEISTKVDCINCKRKLGFPSSQDQTNLAMIKTIRMDNSQSHNSSPSPSKQSNRRNSLSSPSKSNYNMVVDHHPRTDNYTNYPKPLTPTRSAVHPNYMSDTVSAKAKIRTQSAPRTRPMTPEKEHNWRLAKRRMSGPVQDHHLYNGYGDDIDDSEVFGEDYNESLPRSSHGSSHVRVWLR